MSLLGTGAECDDLDIKGSPQTHIDNAWSPVLGAILGGSEDLGRWVLVGGSWSLKAGTSR